MDAAPAMTEYQVKALFLFNFLKYVEWPKEAFEEEDQPITIGVLGEVPFTDDLKRAVEGKQIRDRFVVVRKLRPGTPPSSCHLLFVSSSERVNAQRVLQEVGGLPILTVGEDEEFLENGGIINFSLKHGRVRLAIDLRASQEAGLHISSRLLKVADVVRE